MYALISINYRYKGITIVLQSIETRDKLLLDIGFTWESYLKSDLWLILKTQALSRDKQCQVWRCKQPATEVRHLAYSNHCLLGANTYLLVSVCNDCLETKIEVTPLGNKRSLQEIQKALFRFCSNFRYCRDNGSQIGNWFKKRYLKDWETTKHVIQQISDELPDWYEKHIDAYYRSAREHVVPVEL